MHNRTPLVLDAAISDYLRSLGVSPDAIEAFSRAALILAPEPGVSGADYFYLPENWKRSLTVFWTHGVTEEDFASIWESIFNRRDTLPREDWWRYFCGSCWNIIHSARSVKAEGALR